MRIGHNSKHFIIVSMYVAPPPYPFVHRWKQIAEIQEQYQEKYWLPVAPKAAPSYCQALKTPISQTDTANTICSGLVNGSRSRSVASKCGDANVEEVFVLNEEWARRFADTMVRIENKRKRKNSITAVHLVTGGDRSTASADSQELVEATMTDPTHSPEVLEYLAQRELAMAAAQQRQADGDRVCTSGVHLVVNKKPKTARQLKKSARKRPNPKRDRAEAEARARAQAQEQAQVETDAQLQ